LLSGYFLPYEQRWWGYAIGVGIFLLPLIIQKLRYKTGEITAA
jgi:hypothetical protein